MTKRARDTSTPKNEDGSPAEEPDSRALDDLARSVIRDSIPATPDRRRRRRGRGPARKRTEPSDNGGPDRHAGAEPADRPAAGAPVSPVSPAAETADSPRTPPSPVPPPVVEPGGDGVDLSRPEYYLNRELTWLNFNFRVLHEAQDERTPLLERIKFVAIVSSNLDEFFMKRIGGLKQQVGAGVQEATVDGRTPEQQIAESYALVRQLELAKRETLEQVLERLGEHDIRIVRYDDLAKKQRNRLRTRFVETIYPLLTPQATDPAHPFPFISNLSLNLLVTLKYPDEPIEALARVKVPVGPDVPRFLRVDGSDDFVALEDVMGANLDLLFPGMEAVRCDPFRVTRNANTEVAEEEADDLLAQIESGLRMRRFAPIVRLEVAPDMPAVYRGMLAAELGLDEAADVFEVEGLMGMRDLMELTALDLPELKDPPFSPVDHPQLVGSGSIFHLIREAGTILLEHPYQSYVTSVERLLREASRDPKVRAIKMTLYRTSDESRAIGYLIDAARNGKQVAVVVELKARFDEAANIRWANRLGEMGIHVTYGVVGLKTHCKAILVVRQDYYGIKRYAHIGTGNYNADTARLYSDLGLLTSDDVIGEDLTELFNYLTTGYKPNRRYRKLLPSPKIFKRALLDMIEREIELHRQGESGLLQFKMNALEDADVTRALYRAAEAGVRVDLIVRDSCRLRPGIAGLSDNVRVVSIVGRFLEHARLYYFRNGGGENERYYIGSADCMSRNLMSRVEIVAPVEDPALREELRFLLDAQLADERLGWDMRADGSYGQRAGDGGEPAGSQAAMLVRARKRYKEATRLKRRKPRMLSPKRDD